MSEVVHTNDVSVYQDTETEKIVVVQQLDRKYSNLTEQSPAEGLFDYFGIAKKNEKPIKFGSNLKGRQYSITMAGRTHSYFQMWRSISKRKYIFTSNLPQNQFEVFLTDFIKTKFRTVASAETTEAGICQSCEIASTVRLGLDGLLKDAEDYWTVSCEASAGPNSSAGSKVLDGMKSCLSGAAVSLLQIVQFIKSIGYFLFDYATDSTYRSKISSALGGIIFAAMSDPKGFLKEIYTSILQSLEDTFHQFKTCSLDFKISFACKMIVSWVTGGMTGLKALKAAGAIFKGEKTAANLIVEATKKIMSEDLRAEAKAVSETRPMAKPNVEANALEVTEATANSAHPAKVIKAGGQSVDNSKLNSVAAEVRKEDRAKALIKELKDDAELRGLVERAGDAFPEIADLSKDKAKHVLQTVGTFTDEELQVFKEEVKKPTWKWCK
jgi:hypothetical protein